MPIEGCQGRAPRAAYRLFPPTEAMRVVPSGKTTSSMVRFPTTTSRGGGAIPSLSLTPRTNLFGRDLTIGKPEVNALVPVQDERSDIPDDPDHDHPNHEGEGQGP